VLQRGYRNGSALVPLTVAEIRRLLDAVLPHPRADRDPVTHALKWSAWRRQRQAVAHHCHYRKRSSRHEPLLEYEMGENDQALLPRRTQSLTMRHRLSAVPSSESWTANAPTAVELFSMASSLPLFSLRIL
jgi:hypothetical protein